MPMRSPFPILLHAADSPFSVTPLLRMTRLSTRAILACSSLLVLAASALAQTTEAMSDNLTKMHSRWTENPKDLEAVYIYISSAAETPLQKGLIYQDMVGMYAHNGTRKNADDIAKYALLATELPYHPEDIAQMYMVAGDGIMNDLPAGSTNASLTDADKAEMASYYLKGLKFLLDKISFGDVVAEPPSGASPEVVKEFQARNAMVEKRDAILGALKQLFGTEPDALAKLREVAVHELGGEKREDILLKAMRGEKIDAPAHPVAASASAATSSGSAGSASAIPDASTSFDGSEIIAVLAVAGAGALFWFMRKKPA